MSDVTCAYYPELVNAGQVTNADGFKHQLFVDK